MKVPALFAFAAGLTHSNFETFSRGGTFGIWRHDWSLQRLQTSEGQKPRWRVGRVFLCGFL